MDNAIADARIATSKATLARYQAMMAEGLVQVSDLEFMLAEIDLLRHLAYASDRWDDCEEVAWEWKALADKIRGALN